MNKTKLTNLKNGKLKVEIIISKILDPMDGTWSPDYDYLYSRRNAIRAKVGDITTVVMSCDPVTKGKVIVETIENEKGVQGEWTKAYRHYGYYKSFWYREYKAIGLRKLESITERKRGYGFVVIFSKRLDAPKFNNSLQKVTGMYNTFWRDEDGNRWDCSRYSKEQAIIECKSLEDCQRCFNSRFLTRCNNCNNCHDLHDVENFTDNEKNEIK